jgi:hypothetical protein
MTFHYRHWILLTITFVAVVIFFYLFIYFFFFFLKRKKEGGGRKKKEGGRETEKGMYPSYVRPHDWSKIFYFVLDRGWVMCS